MATKKLTNTAINNQIIGHKDASLEMKRVFKDIDLSDNRVVVDKLFEYPNVREEYLNTLQRKVITTKFYSKIKQNPLKMLKKGMLPFGASIEQSYVEASEATAFNEHYVGSNSVESDLIGSKKPTVHVNYISRNFAWKWKVSISDVQLKTAFLSQFGLSELIGQLINSNLRGVYRKEFQGMKGILHKYCDGWTNKDAGNGLDTTKRQYLQESQYIKFKAGTTINEKVKTIRALSDRLTFESDKYNIAGVQQFGLIDDIVILTTPEFKAELDVDLLAIAFNMDKADIKYRIILVDELPTTMKFSATATGAGTAVNGKAFAIIMDKEAIQAWDTVFEARIFENGDKMESNHFQHHQGYHCGNPFVNFIVLVQE